MRGRYRMRVLLLLLMLVLAACRPVVENRNDRAAAAVIGVLTYRSGEVMILAPQADKRTPGMAMALPPTLAANELFQVLRTGTVVRTGADGVARFVCYNGVVYQVDAAQTVTVTPGLCTTPLPPLPLPALQPDTVVCLNESCSAEGESREEETAYGVRPLLLSPQGKVLTTTLTIRWVAVAAATQYELSLSRNEDIQTVKLARTDAALTCTDPPLLAPHQRCTMVWTPPISATALVQPYFLTVAARTGPVGQPLLSPPVKIFLASPDERAALATALAAPSQASDPMTASFGLATLYQRYGFPDLALTEYEALLAQQPAPLLWIAVGEQYRLLDRQRPAAQAFHNALTALSTATATTETAWLQATATFGLGLVERQRGHYSVAAEQFRRAAMLYQSVGDTAAMTRVEKVLATLDNP